ncbi:hypothetical protein GCM10018773_15380 [Streptomyces candidus]|nr:hypothetical protein GCM10018773_15380 [Streptomyces candidus]
MTAAATAVASMRRIFTRAFSSNGERSEADRKHVGERKSGAPLRSPAHAGGCSEIVRPGKEPA